MIISKQLRDDLLGKIEDHCTMYKLIGSSPEESPAYFNVHEYDFFERILTIKSTQKNIGFTMEIEEEDFNEKFNFDKFWNEFKILRDEYLSEHHPELMK